MNDKTTIDVTGMASCKDGVLDFQNNATVDGETIIIKKDSEPAKPETQSSTPDTNKD